MQIIKSLIFFLVAGVLEISGGYMVWQCIKNNKGLPYFLLGALLLILYGIIPTLQTANFGRTYAAYGGIFIVLSLLWGWFIDGSQPDVFDLVGGFIALIGVLIIMYWPR